MRKSGRSAGSSGAWCVCRTLRTITLTLPERFPHRSEPPISPFPGHICLGLVLLARRGRDCLCGLSPALATLTPEDIAAIRTDAQSTLRNWQAGYRRVALHNTTERQDIDASRYIIQRNFEYVAEMPMALVLFANVLCQSPLGVARPHNLSKSGSQFRYIRKSRT